MNAETKSMMDVMQSALVAVARMQLLLSNEYQALSNADSRVLETISRDKQELMTGLEQVQSKWDVLLARQGLPSGAEGMRSWLKSAEHLSVETDTGDINLTDLWQDLSDGLYTVRKLNGVNGAIIAESDRRVRDLLGTLRGNRQTSLYGQDGKTSAFTGGKALASY